MYILKILHTFYTEKYNAQASWNDSLSVYYKNSHGVTNACTLVPAVSRWHKKMEFKFHFYLSFFFDLVKWNSISISIFRFLSTCDTEKRIWISFFVFRFRITLENGFQFRFSYLHCLFLKNRLEFFAWIWKVD